MRLTSEKRQELTCIVVDAKVAAIRAQDALNTADYSTALKAVDDAISALLDAAKRLHNSIATEV